MRVNLLTAFGGLLFSVALTHGQLRIAQYNSGNVKSGTSTVLEQIGHELVNGISRPIDVLIVQEQSNAASVNNLASTLNGIYGPGSYVAAPYVGITSGGGLPAMVYRASSVALVASPVAIGTVSTSTNARQTIRYQLRPVGYDSAADFFIYASHFKASNTSTDRTRRNVEAATNRANADAMGPGRNIIYAGDFNLYSGNEAGFQTLTAPGTAQAIDPVNAPLTWNSTSNRVFHTQSPVTSMQYPGQTTGGMNDRFDFQLITAELNDGEGMALIPGSYRAFGNNGTHPLNGAINHSSNTWTNTGLTIPRQNVLSALIQASDHIPVVADYQLPARMAVNIGPVPNTVIVGAAVPVNVSVTNSAPVTTALGADELDYLVSGSGAIVGGTVGVATTTLGGNTHQLNFNTTAPGIATGTVSVTSSSESVPNGSVVQARSTTVLAHATPSFDPVSQVTSIVLDFGTRARGLVAPAMSFLIHNLADVSGFTAGLDIDSIFTAGATDRVSTTLAPYKNQPAGAVRPFEASLDTSALGQFEAMYGMTTSDQDLPGAAPRLGLSVQLAARVAIGGDANLDGVVNIDDLGTVASRMNSFGGWTDGDFDRNGWIDVNDLGILASNWQVSESLGPLGLASTTVPEPATPLLLPSMFLATCRRRKRSTDS